jgi:hypothetical protein
LATNNTKESGFATGRVIGRLIVQGINAQKLQWGLGVCTCEFEGFGLKKVSWYSAILPGGGRTQAGSRPGTRTFEFASAGNTVICNAATFEGRKGRTFEQLQAGIPQLKASFESAAAKQLNVQESGILELRDDGANHVRGAYWAGLSERNLYITMMVIEVPKGNIIIGCEAKTIGLSKYLTTMVFRLAEGAL